MSIVNCTQCDKEFDRPDSKPTKGNVFCSQACNGIYNTATPEKTAIRFWKYVNKESGIIVPYVGTECWVWMGSRNPKSEYGSFYDPVRGYHSIPAHRYSYFIHNGEFDDSLLVCHKCDVRYCVNPEHLFLGTHLDNNRDKIKKGRARYDSPKGEQNGHAKLTREQVDFIRAHYKVDISGAELGRMFGVTRHAIYNVASGIRWKD